MSIEIFKTKILPLKTSAFRLAYRLVGQGVDAEDIVQDTMLRMWEMRVQWEKLDCPEGYLMTVCRNLCYDFLRRKIRQRGISIDDGFDTRRRRESRFRIRLSRTMSGWDNTNIYSKHCLRCSKRP